MITPTTISTAGPVTWTPAQIMSGWINRDCAGAARTDTLPSAATMCQNVQGCMVGTAFDFELRNASAGAFAVTLAPGAGGTINPAASSVAQSNTRTYTFIFTSVTFGSEAYTVYSRATGPF